MKFNLRKAKKDEINKAFTMFKAAAESIAKKNIDHWQYWKNPPQEKIAWVQEGFEKEEFFFIESQQQEIIGMLRILEEDLRYWGKTTAKAKYIHSLVVLEKFTGKNIGQKILQKIAEEAKKQDFEYLRLDCEAKNTKLCNYYQQQGFIKVGEQKLGGSIYNLYQKKLINAFSEDY